MAASKPFWASKTILSGVAQALLTAWFSLGQLGLGLPEIPPIALIIDGSLLGFSVVNGRVKGNTPISGGSLPR